MSAGEPLVLPAAPPRFTGLDPIFEECAWCGHIPLSCIACIECREFFCQETCHREFLVNEDARQRSHNGTIAGMGAVN